MQVQAIQTKTYHTVSSDDVITRVPSEDVELIWKQVSSYLV